MIRFYPILTAVFLSLTLWACNSEQSNPATEPSILKPQTVDKNAPNSEDASSTGEQGSFEVMVADFESKDRVIWQKPDMAISLLGDLKGKTVADIGAGTGYFTFRLVSKAEKVIGIDIDQRFINFMDSVKVRLATPYQSHFESRLASPNDPKLAPEEVDAVMIVNTYGYIEKRTEYMQKVYDGMRPGAQLLIIDFKKNSLPVGPSDEYKVSIGQVQQELRSVGFTITNVDRSSLEYQYIVQAVKEVPNK